MKSIVLSQGPAIRGHYSHAVVLPNGMVALSGQKAWHPISGELMAGDIETQTRAAFHNVATILRGVGLSLASVVRIQCHLASVEHYERFNVVYADILGPHRPARTTLAGYELRDGALVELVVDAFTEGSST